MAILIIVLSLVVPAFTSSKRAGDTTNAAFEVAGVLENARAYAMANNTYVWVGFFEADASISSAATTAGIGRIIISTVGSKDGTLPYDPKSPAKLDPSRLFQINKLTTIENIHLKTAGSENFPIGSDVGGDTFATRPAVDGPLAQIGDTSPTDSTTPFQYPVGVHAAAAQYTFSKVLQFSPRGEVTVTSGTTIPFPLSKTVEVGLQPARGKKVDEASPNVVAIQITGIAGNVKIYRR